MTSWPIRYGGEPSPSEIGCQNLFRPMHAVFWPVSDSKPFFETNSHFISAPLRGETWTSHELTHPLSWQPSPRPMQECHGTLSWLEADHADLLH